MKRGKGFTTPRLGLIYTINQHCGADKSLLVDYLFTDWNQIVAELQEWEKIKQAFSLAL
jgi:hypothetical protein